MPRSCPCRTCERLEEAKEERGLEEVFICFFFVNKFFLGGTVHNLPIATRFFHAGEFQEHIELNMMAFLPFCQSAFNLSSFFVLKYCSNFCFPLATSFPAFFIGYTFSRQFHQFPASAIFWRFFPLYLSSGSCLNSHFPMENVIL